MWPACVCLVFLFRAGISILLFINHREIKTILFNNRTNSIDSSEAMHEDEGNSQHVRSINNVVQGVDQTPNDPKYATFLQHRYCSGVSTAELHLNRIHRELLDPETPSPLPEPPSKAPIVVEGLDQTPDDPNWATFYEYRYSKDGVREAEPRYIKKPRECVDVELKFTATMKVPGAPTTKLASTTTRKVVRKIALNPDHSQFASLSNKSTYDIIETTKFRIPAAYAQSSGTAESDKHQVSIPAETITATQSTESPQKPTTQPTLSPSTKSQTSSPPTPAPSVKLKMGRNKKKTVYKKGNCGGKCSTVVLSQACRVHKAVLDSKDYVEDLLCLINSRFEDLHHLKHAWEDYDRKTVKELCPTCSSFHGRGLTKTAFQRDHGELIDSFYHTVEDLKERVKYELDGVVADKEDLKNIIAAARSISADRGEDEDGEMHLLGEELADLYDAEIEALAMAEEEYRRERPFFQMDEYRAPSLSPKKEHASFRPGTEDDALLKKGLEAELERKKLKVEQQEEEVRLAEEEATFHNESPKYRLGDAQKRCEERSFRRLEEKIRMKKWQDEGTKIKLRAMVEVGLDSENDEEEEGMGGVGDVQWWMLKARQECKRDTGRDDLFGSTLAWKMLNARGMVVGAEFGGVGLRELGVEEDGRGKREASVD